MSTERDEKEDKAMTNTNDARRAHEVLDGLFAGRVLSRENEQLLRNFLPPLPKQKTLEGIATDVYIAWNETYGSDWEEDTFGDLEVWLGELHEQLKGLMDTPVTVPALPAGMRLADHWNYGRVVVSPVTDDGERLIFCLDNTALGGAGRRWVHEDSLTFIDAEPAKPAHPEFLETEADYQNAPEGTIIALDDAVTVWLKKFGGWRNTAGDHGVQCIGLADGRRRVLRWGWGE